MNVEQLVEFEQAGETLVLEENVPHPIPSAALATKISA
jgi:hypothetical protein